MTRPPLSPPPRRWLRRLLAGAVLVTVAACGRPGGDGKAGAAGSPPATAPAGTLRVLAGSELRELEADLKQAAASAGVDLQVSYAGTLDMVERVNAGEPFDAILPPNGAYPTLALTRTPVAREKLFYSRVALGVRTAKAAELGWDRTAPTWADIAAAAGGGRLSFAMTNPTASNTGMSALFAVAAAGAGKTEDLAIGDVKPDLLRAFLSGQKVTAGSSGWLADAYVRDPAAVDALVNYEAVLLRLNERLAPADRLVVVYPRDGVISADYPLMLLDATRRPAWQAVVDVLRAAAFQDGPVQRAFLRPSSPGAALAAGLSGAPVAELAFPNRLDVIDAVLASFQGSWRRPATSIFVLDVSGSMEGARLEAMRAALVALAGGSPGSRSERLLRFQSRERVALIIFSGEVAEPHLIGFAAEGEARDARDQVATFAGRLRAGGGTAIFSAVERAYLLALDERKADPQRLVSIVLLTDGENNHGKSLQQFSRTYDRTTGIRVFPILFGEASPKQMADLADLTGGKVFDGRKVALPVVFREIRGYQ